LKKKLHILFLCSWYPSKVLPNNGDFIQRHAEAIALQHKVTVIHIISDKKRKKETIVSKKEEGVFTHIGYITYSKNPIIKGYRFLKMYRKMLRLINSIDMVHVNVLYPFGLLALHLKWFKNIPFIISEHSTEYLNSFDKKTIFIKKLIVKNACYVCPVSDSLKQAMLKKGLKGRYAIVPNVVDTNCFFPSNKKNNSFSLIHISNLTNEHKNISGMLETAKILENKIPNLKWFFVGGNVKNYLSLINQLSFADNTIRFIPHISQQELSNILSSAHALISYSNYETFGITLMEAIACGTPVISTNTGIASVLHQKKWAILTPFKNNEALANNIFNFFNSKKSYDGNKMHTFVTENYSKEVIAQKFTKLYYQCLNLSN